MLPRPPRRYRNSVERYQKQADEKARRNSRVQDQVQVDFVIDTTAGSGKRWWEKVEEPKTIWRACVSKDGLDYYVNTETGQTTWEKPEELMTEEEMNNSGDWFWIPHPVHCFVPARVIDETKKRYLVETMPYYLDAAIKKKVDKTSAIPLLRSSLKRIVADLTLLDAMSAPLILHCLRKRFESDKIYTNVGSILISVNPYQRLPLYTESVLRKYAERSLGAELPPHVFNIAHEAYTGVRSFGKNQSIIISGESGAGKTEATKQCLQYLARVAGSVSDVEKKVLQANPILEAFGNAKTLRNDNSSRFGKYLEIFLDSKGRISESETENYLLEKVRVVQPASKERNFHIFYQLTKAASTDLRRKLKLAPPSSYSFLRGCVDVDTIDDTSEFNDLITAFKDLGVPDSERDEVFSICAAILSLGNATFRDNPTLHRASAKDPEATTVASGLLGVEIKELETALTTREIRIRGREPTLVGLNQKEATHARDALCKFVYGRLFDWLVRRVNKAMRPKGDAEAKSSRRQGMKSIGILDIFGFEIFDHNSFEQLCINFTNEMLQQHFNQNTFKLEQAMYRSEGILFDEIEFIDNQPMLDLITKKPNGILPMLDEELVLPKGSDKTFLQRMARNHKSNKVFESQMKLPHCFAVKHYAGKVLYDSNGFLEKNRDTLSETVIETLQGTKMPLLKKLYPKQQMISARERKSSLAKQFQGQLSRLMRSLNQTQPHYIRCIKPNNDKAPMCFIAKNCHEQLLYSGVFEAVAIRKQGFPFRLKLEEFVSRYSVCVNNDVGSGGLSSKCRNILEKMGCEKTNTRLGKSRVLYRAEEHKKLELKRSICVKNQEISDALRKLSSTDAKSLDPKAREAFFIDLADAVREADIFRVNTSDANRARKMLEAFVEARMDPKTKKMLEEASQSKDLNLLRAVVARCEKEGYRTKLTRKCKDLLASIEDAEAALEVAIKSMEEEFLEKALDMCKDIPYTGANQQKAKKLLRNILKAKTGLQRAMGRMKRKWLNQALEFCDSIGYDTPDVQKCRQITHKVNVCFRLLKEGKGSVNQQKLAKAIRACDKIKYRSPLEHEVRGLLFRVRRINEELESGYVACIEDQVRTVVAAADEIKMPGTEKLKKWRKFVNGSYDSFLSAQYKHAVKMGDSDRSIQIMIRRKDILVNQNKTNLTLDKYPLLKERMNWASEKWWGSTERRAKNMLSFQYESLHAPLSTTVDGINDQRRKKELRRQVTAAFETIQKFMGQRNTSKMPQRIKELLSDALQNQEIRSEVYMSFIKQCTNNPEPEKVPRVWALLSLCLSFFPPNPDFEDYLEAWLREPNFKHSADQFHCRGLLRRSVFSGADTKSRCVLEDLKDVNKVTR
ncbi:hypothetical protein AAMO2058_000839200 [Amorphochlora amoebiformis]